MLNFYSTYVEFLSNFLCNWHELYSTHWRFFVHLYQPIHWYLPRILTFLSEQRAPISTMFACRALHNVLWSQHSNVQVSIFVTCLNFAGTGLRLWQLYVAFAMTWYLAFTTSGRTAEAVRPVISGRCNSMNVLPQYKLIGCHGIKSMTFIRVDEMYNYLHWVE